VLEEARGGAEAAFEAAGLGAEPGAGVSDGEVPAGARDRAPAEFAVGRLAAPGLVAAVGKIEQDRGRNDRHHGAGDREASTMFREPCHHPVGGSEPEGGAAAQHDGIHGADGRFGPQQLDLARARAAAADVDTGDGCCVRENHRRPRSDPRVLGGADGKARNVGDGVQRAGANQPNSAVASVPILPSGVIDQRLALPSPSGLPATLNGAVSKSGARAWKLYALSALPGLLSRASSRMKVAVSGPWTISPG